MVAAVPTATASRARATLDLRALLVRTRREELRHGADAIPAWALAVGLAFGALSVLGTIALAIFGPSRPGATIDLLAFSLALWCGGRLAQAAVGENRGALAPEVFRLLPVPRRRLARALLLTGLQDPALVLCAAAFCALIAYAAGQSLSAVLVALVAGALLTLALGLAATVAGGALSAGSRGGRDLATLVIALGLALLGTAGATLPLVVGAFADGRAPALADVVRWLPSGWAPDAVDAATRGQLWLTLAPLAGLLALSAGLVAVWPGLLQRRMDDRAVAVLHTRIGRRRLLPGGPAWAVAGKELRLWTRHQLRVICALVSVFFGLWPALLSALNGGGTLLPFAGAGTLLLAAACAVNLYGSDGPWLWSTALVPGAARADVRGRQLGWLLLFGPYAIVLTVALTWIGGQDWAWPWALALTAALLGGGAGLVVAGSLLAPLPIADDGGPTPAWSVKFHLALPIALVSTFPPAALLVLGAIAGDGLLTWAAVPVGIVTGLALALGLGRFALGRLDGHEPDLIGRLDPRVGIDEPGA